jgi:hypothetical protein
MKPKVYLETSVLSYLAARPSRDAVTAGRQAITRRWWDTEREKYSLVVSEAVEAECERGDPDLIGRRRALLDEVSLSPVNERILELAKVPIVPGAIPVKAGTDAVHIAAAAIEQCEFLLAWNFRHIANVRIRRAVERILAKHLDTRMAIRKRPSAPGKNLCEQKPWEDEVLRELYAARDAYGAEHGYDLDRIYADLKRREAGSRLRRAHAVKRA